MRLTLVATTQRIGSHRGGWLTSRRGDRCRTLGLVTVLAAMGICLAGCGSATHITWGRPPVEDPEPGGPAYLQAYKESHYRDLGTEITGVVAPAELLQTLRGVRLLYLGDHHEDQDCHDRFHALLGQLRAAGFRLAIGLEAIGSQDEPVIAQYLARRISLDQVRRQIAARWPESWLDSDVVDAPFYRDLIVEAGKFDEPVFALEPVPRRDLNERDDVIANHILAASAKYPDRLLVILVGHAHLLGSGGLIARVGMPSVAISARMSRSLEMASRERTWRKDEFLRSSSGVLFFSPKRNQG